jgi:hypothetical protein
MLHPRRYRIRFPSGETRHLAQDQAYFLLEDTQGTHKIRFHDYHQLYSKPGLYEQLFYDRLKCGSPAKLSGLLKKVVGELGGNISQLRVLDVGAGNGMMGQALAEQGVARLVGIDISQEACDATQRDRPGVYDAYYVTDLTQLSARQREELLGWRLDCMTTVAALGFGDIPPKAFMEVFNIKESFLDNRDTSGFSVFIKQLILSDYIDLHHLERYRHRISIDGDPLYYFAVVARKNSDVGADLLAALPQ